MYNYQKIILSTEMQNIFLFLFISVLFSFLSFLS